MSLILLFIVVALVGLLIAWGFFSRYVSRLVDGLFFSAKGVSRQRGFTQHFKDGVK